MSSTLPTSSLPTEGVNSLLQALPADARNAVLNNSTHCVFGLGEVLLAPNRPSEFAYFPTTCVVSFVRTLGDGTTIEVGLVGYEGVVGIDIFLGADTHPNTALIQGVGSAWRMEASALKKLFHENAPLQAALLRFTGAYIVQITQTAACNRLHDLHSRLARWLLMMHDRVTADEIRLTQEFLSHMLGSRAAGVNEAVQRLEAARVIEHRRQLLTVIDRAGLEKIACECYETVRREYDLRLPPAAA